jgi:Rad3-related DNA helicase
MSKLILNFPDNYQPNDNQVKILNAIETAIANNEKFIVCNAPTGSGKSFIAPTLAKYASDPSSEWNSKVDDYSIFGEDGIIYAREADAFGVYALTITKALQDQYKETFDFATLLKGQGNYQCEYDPEVTVDNAPCLYVKGLKKECWDCNRCSYYNDRNKMLKSSFATLNYSMYFSLPDHLKKRKILVLDEASELEEQLVNQFTCEIDIPFLMKTETLVGAFPSDEKAINVLNWLNKTSGSVSTSIASYMEYLKNKKNKDSEFFKKTSECNKLQRLQKSIELLISTYYDSQYIVERVDKKIKFTPLKVDKLSKYLFDNADHVVLLSATIIDHVSFCRTLGVEDYSYIEVESKFDSTKSPIYILAKQKINFQNLKSLLPTICKQIEGILEEHADHKGIIHTHTQYIADYIRDNVKSKRLLCREIGVKNEDILEQHVQSKQPTVLVSPSMTYGVDLKGDLANFQIVLKAPWLPTKDARIEKMMKLDGSWYVNKMLCTLVQACGRGVRGESDECATYILDGGIFDSIAKNKRKLPKYFLDRLQ